jgi:phosphoribosyl-dephospho-CoA transferase
MNWKRHTLIDISDAGRKAILSELAGDNSMLRAKLGDLLLPEKGGVRIPGIVRREEVAPRSGCVAVGFCGQATGGNGRFRLAAFANLEDVLQVTTPYELLAQTIPLRTHSTRALASAATLAGVLGIDLGVWGSAALELYTGLPYTHNGSDLDLLVAAAPRETLYRFLKDIKKLEECFALRIDTEVDLQSGYGVQLKELLGQTRTVIGKGLTEVELLSRERILADLPQ